MPMSIWREATPDEKDQYYLQAGFDPNLPVLDNGVTVEWYRVRQDPVASTMPPAVLPVATPVSITTPQAGDDLRDFSGLIDPSTITDEFGAPANVGIATVSVAGRALRLVLGGGGGRLTAAMWNSLPSIVRSALTQLGIGVGVLVAFNGDIPFITLPGQDDTSLAPVTGPPPIQIGGAPAMVGVQVVGSWNTNPTNPEQGVTFYRLSDGKLAVQNKKGRWKVWKPKSPIVLYPNGASNLKTMLRADRALNRQAKKIAAMLNRRAPRRKASKVVASSPVILGNNARVVDV